MNLHTISTLRRHRIQPVSRGAPAAKATNIPAKTSIARALLTEGHVARATAIAHALILNAPFDADVLHLRGDCLIAGKQPAEAIAIFDKALSTTDSDAIWASKGDALLALHRPRRAAASFERAAALAPDAGHRRNMAACLLQAGGPRKALEVLAARAGPDATLRARALAQLGRRQEAINTAIAAPDDDAGTLRLLLDLSRTGPEKATARQRAIALASAPEASVHTIAEAAGVAADRFGDAAIARLTTCSDDPATPGDVRAHAHLGLFRIFDRRGDTTAAAAHLAAHHACASDDAPQNRNRDSAVFARLMGLRFMPLPPTKTTILPIFVSGLPGSGVSEATRVLEQSVQTGPARELTLVDAVMTRFVRVLHAENRRDVTREDLLALQSELREGLVQAADGADVVIDTARLNFRWSGLLAAALPEARIVHMTRDHVQTGWAMYRGDFQHPDLTCRHDLTYLASCLLRSAALMRHWEDMRPNVFGVSGDALCRPGGRTARAMLQGCGLNWMAHCTVPDYAPNRDWHRYAATVAPLRNALAQFAGTQTLQLPA